MMAQVRAARAELLETLQRTGLVRNALIFVADRENPRPERMEQRRLLSGVVLRLVQQDNVEYVLSSALPCYLRETLEETRANSVEITAILDMNAVGPQHLVSPAHKRLHFICRKRVVCRPRRDELFENSPESEHLYVCYTLEVQIARPEEEQVCLAAARRSDNQVVRLVAERYDFPLIVVELAKTSSTTTASIIPIPRRRG